MDSVFQLSLLQSIVIGSTMRIIYLSVLFSCVRMVRNVHSPHPGWTAGSSTPQSQSLLNLNPCDATRVNSGAQNAHFPCYKECLALRTDIGTLYSSFPNYRSTQYLREKCGMATEGKCSIGTESSICWCHTKVQHRDQQKNTLSNCRSAIRLMETFTDAVTTTMEAVHMQHNPSSRSGSGSSGRSASLTPPPPPASETVPRRARTDRSRRPNTGFIASCCGLGGSKRAASPDSDDDGPPRRPGKEPKASTSGKKSPGSAGSPRPTGLPEGKVLFADMILEGEPIQVMLDTGAAFCMIHPFYAGEVTRSNQQLVGLGNKNYQVQGKTSIKLVVSRGVTVPVTGFVTEHGFEVILGVEFFVAYGARMRLFEKKMDLSTGLSTVTLDIRFAIAQVDVDMMNLYSEGYTSLRIPAILNGIETRVVIDTGAGITVVNRNVVYQPITPFAESSFASTFAGPVGFAGSAKVNLMIQDITMPVLAYVPQFVPTVDLLTGNEFNEQHVEIIDFDTKIVTLRLPTRSGFTQVRVQALITRGE